MEVKWCIDLTTKSLKFKFYRVGCFLIKVLYDMLRSRWRCLSFDWSFVMQLKVHVLPREMFGVTTFGIAMALLKWLPLRVVDKLILFMANLTLGNTDKLGLRRPKTGPLELKNATGKTPVLDTGALSLIKSGNIKVSIQRFPDT